MVNFRNQELVEKLKNDIWQQRNKEQDYFRAAELTKNVLNSNRATLIDMILKLEESDENGTTTMTNERDMSNTAEVLSGKTSNQALLQVELFVISIQIKITNKGGILQILSKKLRKSLIATRQISADSDKDESKAFEVDTLNIPMIDVTNAFTLNIYLSSFF